MIRLPDKVIHPVRTVREALEKVNPEWFNYTDQTVSRPETVKKMSCVRQGHNFKDIPELRDNPNMHSDRYYRLDPNSPSPTIVNWRKDSRQQQCGNGCTLAIGKLIKETVKKVLVAFHNKGNVPVID